MRPCGSKTPFIVIVYFFFFLLAVQYHLWDLIAPDQRWNWGLGIKRCWVLTIGLASIFPAFHSFFKQTKDIGVSQVKRRKTFPELKPLLKWRNCNWNLGLADLESHSHNAAPAASDRIVHISGMLSPSSFCFLPPMITTIPFSLGSWVCDCSSPDLGWVAHGEESPECQHFFMHQVG